MGIFSKRVNLNSYFRILFVLSACFFAASCATPTSPTGGPPDKTPPKITSTQPSTGTVNFKGDKVVLKFSEYVERKSLSQALKIEPNLGISHNIHWGKKSAAIEFARSLPDSTTVIITIGTDFSDLHGNSLGKPDQVAFSTGPSIDKGELVGRVIDARTGKSKKGQRILLYRKPIDLSKPANYIAESDTGGIVHFSYLSPGIYKAFWVGDRNRDDIWEPKTEMAQPFRKEFVSLKKAGKDTLGTLYIAKSDTSKPEINAVGLFSSRRLRLRFSENIVLTDSTHFILRDSISQHKYGDVYKLYVSPDQPYILFAHSTKKLSPDSTFSLHVLNITDDAGNVQPSTKAYFTGSSQKDTTRQRLVGSSAGAGIFANEPVQVAYAGPITKAPIRDSLYVIVGDSVHKRWKNLSIHRNIVRVSPDSVWKTGKKYTFEFWNPIAKARRKVNPQIWHKSDLGSLEVSFEDSSGKMAKGVTTLLLNNKQGKTVMDTTFTKKITLKNLTPQKHQLILYQDLNRNSVWDPGMVSPFKKPEPYLVRNNVPVKSGFTSELTVNFRQTNIPKQKKDSSTSSGQIKNQNLK
jgi:uncharacterized cupredoxin-like copper-binding protein